MNIGKGRGLLGKMQALEVNMFTVTRIESLAK